MGRQFYPSGNSSGFQYENQRKVEHNEKNTNGANVKRKDKDKDEDLIIEENTIYEIDRECYERMKKQKKRK